MGVGRTALDAGMAERDELVVLQLSKCGRSAIGRVERTPSHVATSNSLLMNTAAKHKTMQSRCRQTVRGERFSTKTGTFMESSNLGFQTSLFATYLISTPLNSVSSMKLHQDVSITQKTA